MTYVLIGIAVVLVLIVLYVVGTYNALVAGREAVRAAWAQIDVFLKRRYDLIPNLVETVKGYAAHEKDTLQAVIAARNQAVSASSDPARLSQAEGALSGALSRLFALSEAYPDLKANTNFMQLQSELAETENQIASRRSGYNALVQNFNTRLMSFPTNLIAAPFGFTAQQFFEIQNADQREAPQVKF
jgi:LemA protein